MAIVQTLNGTMTMIRIRSQLKPMLLACVVLAGGFSSAIAAAPQPAAVASNEAPARVWILRPTSSADTYVWGASPTVYANSTPLAAMPPNSALYRDLAPGTYSFSVQPYGSPGNVPDTVRLAPGSQTYLEVQWFGWSTTKQAALYTRKANRARLEAGAAPLL